MSYCRVYSKLQQLTALCLEILYSPCPITKLEWGKSPPLIRGRFASMALPLAVCLHALSLE